MTDEEKYTGLSRKKRFACNIVTAALIFACGCVLLVFGIIGGVIGVGVSVIVVPLLLLTGGLILFVTSIIQMNTVTFYMSIIFFVCAFVGFLAHFSPLTYGMLYPFYIASPAIASLFTVIMSGEYRFHLKIILVFSFPSVFFALFASGIWTAGILAPALVMYAGLVALYGALSANSATEE